MSEKLTPETGASEAADAEIATRMVDIAKSLGERVVRWTNVDQTNSTFYFNNGFQYDSIRFKPSTEDGVNASFIDYTNGRTVNITDSKFSGYGATDNGIRHFTPDEAKSTATAMLSTARSNTSKRIADLREDPKWEKFAADVESQPSHSRDRAKITGVDTIKQQKWREKNEKRRMRQASRDARRKAYGITEETEQLRRKATSGAFMVGPFAGAALAEKARRQEKENRTNWG